MNQFTWIELNEKSYEELNKIRESILEDINKKEEKRQGLIKNILFLQNFNDLFSIRNGLFNQCHCERNKIDKSKCQSHCDLTRGW